MCYNEMEECVCLYSETDQSVNDISKQVEGDESTIDVEESVADCEDEVMQVNGIATEASNTLQAAPSLRTNVPEIGSSLDAMSVPLFINVERGKEDLGLGEGLDLADIPHFNK